jgi:hypothetical protein
LVSLQDVIETAVAVGTFALAFVTWRMAVATRRVAEDSEAQLELLRRSVVAAEQANALNERQAVAAERASEATERQIAASSTPKLIVDREMGDRIVGGSEGPDIWSVTLRNVGQAPATIIEARINLAPQPLILYAEPGSPIPAGYPRLLAGDALPDVLALGESGTVPFPLSVTYSGPNGDRWNMQATLRGDGENWSVMEAERHKDAGPAPRETTPR